MPTDPWGTRSERRPAKSTPSSGTGMLCPKCQTMGKPVPGKGYVCPKCAHRWIPSGNLTFKGPEQRRIDKLDDLGVIEDISKFQQQMWPTDFTVRCGACENWGAYYYQRQTRRSDEPPTTFYQCTKCKRKWKKSK